MSDSGFTKFLKRHGTSLVKSLARQLPHTAKLARKTLKRNVLDPLDRPAQRHEARSAFKEAAGPRDVYGEAKARLEARKDRARRLAELKQLMRKRLNMAGKKPTIPPEIKRHKPAMNGPKPPGSVRKAVDAQVRGDMARQKAARQAPTAVQKTSAAKKPLKAQFGTAAKPTLTQQFGKAASRSR